MIFIAILIVLAFIQLQGAGKTLQQDGWLKEWAQFLAEKVPHEGLRLTILIALPMLIVALLDTLFTDVLFGALSLGLYVGVLIYSLGRGEFNEAVDGYLMSWRGGDLESAYEKAQAIGDFHQSETITEKQGLHEQVRSALLYEGYQRWFAVIFWFLLLGPAGALAYRLCYLTGRLEIYPHHSDSAVSWDEPLQRQALQFTHYLDWLPARLLSLSFALTGRFESCTECVVKQFSDNMPAPEFIDSSAVAALSDEGGLQLSSDNDLAIEQGEREISDVQSLLSRSVVCWLVIIALLQLIV